MKKFFIFIMAAAAIAGCKGADSGCTCEIPETGTQIIAHRGYWKTEGSAQNSMASLMKAQELCVFGSECDGELLADDTYVLFHDTKIHGRVLDSMTYPEMCADTTLVNGEKPVLVADYFKQLKANRTVKSIFELKAQSTVERTLQQADTLMTMVREYGLQNQIEFISFSLDACRYLAQKMPEIPTYYLNGELSPAELHEMGIHGLDYYYTIITDKHPEWVEEAHALGMKVNVWTVQDSAYVAKAVELGVDFITTDEPVKVRGYISNSTK